MKKEIDWCAGWALCLPQSDAILQATATVSSSPPSVLSCPQILLNRFEAATKDVLAECSLVADKLVVVQRQKLAVLKVSSSRSRSSWVVFGSSPSAIHKALCLAAVLPC